MSVSICDSLTREQPLTDAARAAAAAAMAEIDVAKYCTDDPDDVPAKTGLFGRRKPRAAQTSGVDCSPSPVTSSPNLSGKRERPMRTVSATLIAVVAILAAGCSSGNDSTPPKDTAPSPHATKLDDGLKDRFDAAYETSETKADPGLRVTNEALDFTSLSWSGLSCPGKGHDLRLPARLTDIASTLVSSKKTNVAVTGVIMVFENPTDAAKVTGYLAEHPRDCVAELGKHRTETNWSPWEPTTAEAVGEGPGMWLVSGSYSDTRGTVNTLTLEKMMVDENVVVVIEGAQGAREGAAPISTGAITPVMGAVTNDVLDGLKASGIEFNADGNDLYRD